MEARRFLCTGWKELFVSVFKPGLRQGAFESRSIWAAI